MSHKILVLFYVGCVTEDCSIKWIDDLLNWKGFVEGSGCRLIKNPILAFTLVGWKNTIKFFFSLVCEAIGTAATCGLFCQPRVIVKTNVEKQMECRLAGETEVLGENLPQRHFCPSQNPT
jgi:hypothetical protein